MPDQEPRPIAEVALDLVDFLCDQTHQPDPETLEEMVHSRGQTLATIAELVLAALEQDLASKRRAGEVVQQAYDRAVLEVTMCAGSGDRTLRKKLVPLAVLYVVWPKIMGELGFGKGEEIEAGSWAAGWLARYDGVEAEDVFGFLRSVEFEIISGCPEMLGSGVD